MATFAVRTGDHRWPPLDGLEWFLIRVDALLYDVLAEPSVLITPGRYEVTRRAFIEVRGTFPNVPGPIGPESPPLGVEPAYAGTPFVQAFVALQQAALPAGGDFPELRGALKEHGLDEGSAQLAMKLAAFTEPFERYFALGGRASVNPHWERLKPLVGAFTSAAKGANSVLDSMGKAGVPAVGALKEVKDGVELAVEHASALWSRELPELTRTLMSGQGGA